ncbi:zinc-binding protein [Vibrio ishigakensis]|uniref:Zinc-binding protein n=1 Tax=Vibrio ishigakensis TaxID=1481914 RepID=A0A0B8QKZ3_9VIBR|nr:zinc-binding protein [Vibrio ishigakensis]
MPNNQLTIKTLAALLCASLAVPSFASGFRQHGAHVHGFVTYDIAQDGEDLLIDIYAAGMDIVGFEHPANNVDEKKAIDNANTLLSDYSSIIDISPEARCSVTDSKVSLVKSAFTPSATEGARNPFVEHSTHSSFEIKYQFHCQKPEQLSEINTAWFEHFPSTKAISANYFTDTAQNATELDKDHTNIRLHG